MFNTNKKELQHLIPKLSKHGATHFVSLQEYNLLIENNIFNDEDRYKNNRYRYKKFFDIYKKYQKSFISLEIYLKISPFNEKEPKPIVNILKIIGSINILESYETKYNFFMDFYSLVGKNADEYEMSTTGTFLIKFNELGND